MNAGEFKRRLRQNGVCLEWTGGVQARYGAVHLGGNRYERAHRFAYRLLKGQIPDGAQVLHRCDNKLCCNPKHLKLGGYDDNRRDVANRSAVKSRKLTRSGVRKVFAMRKQGLSYRAIGSRVGINHDSVGRILRGELYYGKQFR